MITFGHYGSPNDISGVTTWLKGMIEYALGRNIPVGTVIHYFGSDSTQGSFYQDLQSLNVPVEAVPFVNTSEVLCKQNLAAINKQKPEVFLPMCLATHHYTARYTQDFGLPWVFTMHSDDPEYWALAQVAAPSPEHGVWVVVSEYLKLQCKIRHPQADVRVIPYGVRTTSNVATWNPKRFKIVFSGRMLEEQKRISLVTETLIKACRLSDCIEAVLIGDGAHRDLAEKMVIDHGLSETIRFTGRLDQESLRTELKNAQAILLMSDYEGLPVALLEGMALGLVPMAKHCDSGIPELIVPDETGLILSSDPDEAARSIVELSRHRERWQSMSENAFELVESRYSAAVCMSKWFSLIDELRARSTVEYPIPIPRRMPLPLPDSRLSRMDRRAPRWLLIRILNRIRKLFQ